MNTQGKVIHVNLENIRWPSVFSKRYKMPKKFFDFSGLTCSQDFKAFYAAGKTMLENGEFKSFQSAEIIVNDRFTTKGQDELDRNLAFSAVWCLEQEPPIFCLDADLFDRFCLTKPTYAQDPPYNSFVLCLPGFKGKYIGLKAGQCRIILFVSSFDSNHIACGSLLDKDGSLSRSFYVHRIGDKSDDPIANILIHTIAYMNTYKESADAVSSAVTQTKGVGFGSRQNQPKEFLRPRMISSTQHVNVSARRISDNPVDRTSPTAHWRRGHWHKYLVGKGRTEEKFNWIEPILVGANDG